MAENEKPSVDTSDITKSLGNLGGAVTQTAATFMLTKPTITSAANSFGSLGKKVGAVTSVIEAQVGQYQSLTKSGANFGGNLAEMTLQATSAGLSVKEMSGIISANSEALAGFGLTVNDGAASFLSSMRDMRKENNMYGMQLRNIGMTHEEIGEAMIEVQRMEMMQGRKSAANEASIQEATANYAKDLDLLAKLTGKNADELKKQQAALSRQGDFKAMQLGMSKDMSAAILAASSQADASGIGDLFKDMMIRGFPSKDQRALAGTMGNSMRVMEEMFKAQQAGDHARVKELRSSLTAAAMKDKMANQELGRLGNTTKVTSAIAETFRKTSDFEMAVMAKMAHAKQQGYEMTMEQAQAEVKARMAEAKRQQDAQGGNVDKTGKGGGRNVEDTAVLNAALRGQEAMIDAAAEVQKKFTEKMYNETFGPLLENVASDSKIVNEALALTTKGLNKLSEMLPDNTSITDKDVANKGDMTQVVKELQNFASTTANAEQQIEANLIAAEILHHISEGTAAGNSERMKELLEKSNKLQGKTVDNTNNTDTAPKEGTIDIRRGGTPGLGDAISGLTSFASRTEDFGKQSLAFLHGEELVMTKAQAEQLDAGIRQLAMFGGEASQRMAEAFQNASTEINSKGFDMGASMKMMEDMFKAQETGMPTADQKNRMKLDDKGNYAGTNITPTADQKNRMREEAEREKNRQLKAAAYMEASLPSTGLLGGPTKATDATIKAFSQDQSSTRQGAINTIKSKDGLGMGTDMTEKLAAVFKESGAQMDKLFGDMTANMPKAEVFDGLLETSKQQLGSTMQQISKMDVGNKLTKKLSKAGNAFGNIGL